MIIYAANRAMRIIGMASTELRKGLTVYDDIKTEDVDTGVASFEFSMHYTKSTRSKIEDMLEVGNYILRKDGNDEGVYTIVEYKSDTKKQEISVYAEDAGLDLLNEICTGYTASSAQNIAWYVNQTIATTGFEIGRNRYGSSTLLLTFEEQTAKERLDTIAESFGAEIGFSFEIDELTVSHMYVNIYKSRGKDKGIQLALNREIDSIRVTKSIDELATGLIVVGGTGDNSDIHINLDGYSYDDGDFYVSGKNLYSRSALKKWARFIPNTRRQATGISDHIMRRYESDTVSQAQLCQEAISQLSIYSDPQVNYEIEISDLPDDTALGDTIYIIDEHGELYLQSRILKLETHCAEHKRIATLGDFLIKDSGISAKVSSLADKFSKYAATMKGQTVFDVLTTYTLTQTILTAKVYWNRKDITSKFPTSRFTWYKKTESAVTQLGTGYTITIDNSTMGYGGTVVCKFEE